MAYVTTLTAEDIDDHVHLSWDWASGYSPSASTYTVHRCGAESFDSQDIDVLASGTTATSYDDYEFPQKDIYRRVYYRVATSVSGGATHLSRVVTFSEGSQDRIVQEIRFRFGVAMEVLMGVPSYAFQRRTFGDVCPDCWDPVLGKTTNDRCYTCYGVGLVGGYFAPTLTWVQFQPNDDFAIIDQEGLGQKQTISALMPYQPYMVHGDLIFGNDRALYVVVRNQSTYKSGSVAHQVLTLRQLNRGSVEYELVRDTTVPPIPIDSGIPITR